MSHLSNKVFLVLGSGPGIGRATASFFASKSHSKIGLVARNSEKLAQDKAAVEEAAKKAGRSVEVKTWVTDLADEAALVKTLNEVDGFGKTEVIFFNGARVVLSSLLETPASEIEYDFKITNTALYATAKWAIPRLTELAKTDPSSHPSLLVTNSFLYKDPEPPLFSLSLTKAAQRSLVLSLAKTFNKDGIHVALVSVGGVVASTYKKRNPGYIASQVWDLYNQSPSEFSEDLEIDED